METTTTRSALAQREVERNSALRCARTCYDHLAGVAGVQLFGELVRREWITEGTGHDHPLVGLTVAGEKALVARGVDVPGARSSKRKFGYGCLDWTEREHHLGGALGAKVFLSLCDAEHVSRSETGRSVDIMKPVSGWLQG